MNVFNNRLNTVIPVSKRRIAAGIDCPVMLVLRLKKIVYCERKQKELFFSFLHIF